MIERYWGIVVESFRIVTHSCATCFHKKRVFMKFTFFISRAKQIYTKPLNVSESILKIKVMPYFPFFQILRRSKVICKQRQDWAKTNNEHRIGQYLRNCKCYDIYQGCFRKPLQSYKKTITKNCPKKVRIFFTSCLVSKYFWRLNYC